MLDGASLSTLRAHGEVGIQIGIQTRQIRRGRQQFRHGVAAFAGQAVFVQVPQQRVESLVGRQDDAFGVGCRLYGASALESDMEIQGILAGALDLLKIDALEAICRRPLLRRPLRALLGTDLDNRPVCLVK